MKKKIEALKVKFSELIKKEIELRGFTHQQAADHLRWSTGTISYMTGDPQRVKLETYMIALSWMDYEIDIKAVLP